MAGPVWNGTTASIRSNEQKRKMKRRTSILLLFLSLLCSGFWLRAQTTSPAEKLLCPVRTDNPRDTMKTYMDAMNDYREGVLKHDQQKQHRLNDAVRCFDLGFIPLLARRDKGKEIAILLREVIDRVIVIDYSRIPNTRIDAPWRLKDTEIMIARVTEGERKGQYLFTRDTAMRVHEFYQRVKKLPYLPNSGQGAFYREPWLERNVPAWTKKNILFFPCWQWIGLFTVILLGLVLKTVAQYIIHNLKKIAARTKTQWDYKIAIALERPVGVITAAAFWFFAIHLLRFEGYALTVLTIIVQAVFSIGLIWGFYRLVDVLAEYLQEITSRTESPLDDQMVPLIRKALKIFVVIFGVLVSLQNLNINVMSVLTGLGLGGLAFALAAKDTCANLFGSIMIFLDQPFQVGDWVIVGPLEGMVEEIGFRSTRIRTFYNSVISVPNSTIANANIDNMGRREFRRIKAFFGLTYDTPPEKIEAFLEGIKNIIKANPYTRKDYYHVVFYGYGDFSLNIMLYCFLRVPDWAAELVERQNLYLEILRLAKTIGVEFAFPTQSLHISSIAGQAPPAELPPRNFDELKEGAISFGPNGRQAHPAGQGLFIPPYREAEQEETRGSVTDDS